ncbi:unnamed protein product [Urochloa humidicola]
MVGMHAIPNEVLELIFLHVASPNFLVRSASVCKQWLAIVSNAGFLRRFRSVHGPVTAAGVYKDERWLHSSMTNVDRYLPKFVPLQPSSINDGRHFSLDFLPGSSTRPWVWRIQDSRGSLLLLDKNGYCPDFSFGDMIVCEPATRRYQKIALFAAFPDCALHGVECAYLVDGEEGGGNGLLNFRLVLLLNIYCSNHGCGARLHAAVLMPGGRSWQNVCMDQQQMSLMVGLTKGCVYWYAGKRTVVALDRSTAEFSSFVLPDIQAWDWDSCAAAGVMAVAAGFDGEPRVVAAAVAGGHLKVFARLHGGDGSDGEWALEKSVPPLEAMRSLTVRDQSLFSRHTFTFAHNHNEGNLLLRVHAGTVLPCLYRLDIETVELESVNDYGMAYPCELPWPPALHAFNLH